MPDLKTVIAFLLGQGELDGLWFGEPNPTSTSAFWWRKYLRAANLNATEDEREACAKVAEMAEPYQAADLIRKRGQA